MSTLKYLACGYGTTYVYNASWGKASGSPVTSAQLTDDGTIIASYLKTKRNKEPYSTLWKNSVRLFLVTNFAIGGAATYRIGTDCADASTGVSYSLTVASGFKNVEIGTNALNMNVQHYITDSLADESEYISITENAVDNA